MYQNYNFVKSLDLNANLRHNPILHPRADHFTKEMHTDLEVLPVVAVETTTTLAATTLAAIDKQVELVGGARRRGRIRRRADLKGERGWGYD